MKKILARIVKFTFLTAFLVGASASFNNARAATLTETPANVAQGGTVTATWSAVATPTNRDWIGLYTPAGADTAFIDWIYDNSCNKAGNNSVFVAGSCPFLIPNSLANGQYQLRLFTNNSYTRLATSNNFNVAPIPPARFVDNGDGTISDIQTGLQWEKKTGSVGTPVDCSTPAACPDPHNVNNFYSWSFTIPNPNGTLYTNFLVNLNDLVTPNDGIATPCFAGHCDWRVATINELRSILQAPFPLCAANPCIDPIFSPTWPSFYWSSTTPADSPNDARFVDFNDGFVNANNKDISYFVRAVRGGR